MLITNKQNPRTQNTRDKQDKFQPLGFVRQPEYEKPR